MASWRREVERSARRDGCNFCHAGLKVAAILAGMAIFTTGATPVIAMSAAAPPPVLLSRADPAVVADTGGGLSTLPPVSAVSADGRYVVFTSDSGNLVPGQVSPRATAQIFLFDRTTGTRTLVSHAAGQAATGCDSFASDPVLSADGRWVAYLSPATDLVAGQTDSPGTTDVFLFDRTTGTNVLVSHAQGTATAAGNGSSGLPQGLAISDDGADVAYQSQATNLIAGENGTSIGLFLYDRGADTNTLVSHTSGSATTLANAGAGRATLSGDGRYVAYTSPATDLVAGQTGPTNNADAAFLYDRLAGTNVLVSPTNGSATTAANGESGTPVLSDDGSTVIFVSEATDLVAGQTDTNAAFDVFAYDRATATVTLVSRTSASATTTGAGASFYAVVSADGRYVAFGSAASDLVAGMTDPNGGRDVFLFDRTSGTTTLVSHQDGAATTAANDVSDLPSISADGRYVAFESEATNVTPNQFDTNGAGDVFLYDQVAGTSALVTHSFDTPNGTVVGGGSDVPVLSSDGNWVAFTSTTFDVVQARDLNGVGDVFLYSRASQDNVLVSHIDPSLPSLSPSGASAFPAVSDDGRYVVFRSDAVNLSPNESHAPLQGPAIFLADTLTGALSIVSHNSGSLVLTGNALSSDPLLSADGSHVVYVSQATDLVASQIDSAGTPDVFLYDRATGTNVLVSHHTGAQAMAANNASTVAVLSGDGRFVAYESLATDVVAGQVGPPGRSGVFLYDLATGQSVLVSHAAGSPATMASSGSFSPSLSADGRFVAYESLAADLVSGATASGGFDIYLYDRLSGISSLVSHTAGDPTTGVGGISPLLSADGHFVLFTSPSSALVSGLADSNSGGDAFRWDRQTDTTILVSHPSGAPTTTGNDVSAGAGLSADGRFALWNSIATDLVPGQTGTAGVYELFLADLDAGTTTLVSHADGSPAAGVGYTTAQLSADGAYVAFSTPAPNVVAGQTATNTGNAGDNVFLYDRLAGTTALLSRTPASPQATGNAAAGSFAISADGAAIVFSSAAADLASGDFNGQSDVFLSRNPLPGRVFFTLPPCRLIDTRQNGPALASGVITLVASHGACGIPLTAKEISTNITVLGGTGAGYLTLYPGDLTAPLASTINFAHNQTRSNNAILQLSLDGLGDLAIVSVIQGAGSVEVVIDVSGYFE
jgi:Tol biopolymer transport system component